MKLSIIIPVFNVEKYLPVCLDSILGQGLGPERMEIILVNDSSTDKSREVAERYAATNAGIRIIDQSPNQGPSASRNNALDTARGEYVMFIDSDDHIAPGMLELLLRTMEEEKLDMLGFDYQGVDEQGNHISWGPRKANISDSGIITGEEYILRNDFYVMVYMYIYRREFLERNKLRMMHGVTHEDEEFTPRALCLCGRIRHIPLLVYYYLYRPGSIMTRRSKRNISDLIRSMGSLNRFLQNGTVKDRRVAAKLRYLMSIQLYGAMRDSLKMEDTSPRETRRMMKEEGLIPLANPRGHLNRFFINRFLPGFILYNKYIRRKR